MEHSQLSQMVTWLDKEHQRDRTELGKLQQRVETLAAERDEQARHVTELEAELAALRARVDRVAQVEDYLERFKQEINILLEKSESRRQQALRDSDRVRQVEIDNVTKVLGETRREVERFRRYDDELAARRTDMQRLSETVGRLQQQVMDAAKDQEERARHVTYLEEQRRQDNKRIAELQAQSTELLKRLEMHFSKIQLLEQLPSRINELKSNIQEMSQQQNKALEKAQFQDAQRERQAKNWGEQAELQRQRMDEYQGRMDRYAEQYQRIKKAMDDLQEFKEQIQRQQHETAELQRLAENRQKSQFEEWQAQEDQRWKKQSMEWDHQVSEFDRALAELIERSNALEKQVHDNQKHLQLVLQMAEEDAQMRAVTARDWQMRFEEIVEQE